MVDLEQQRQIWSIFIDAQEQIIKLRSAPFSILPDRTQIEGDKIHLYVNEDQNIDDFTQLLCSIYKIDREKFSLKDEFIIQNANITNTITGEDKLMLVEYGAKCFIKFYLDPVIDGKLIIKSPTITTKVLDDFNKVIESLSATFPSIIFLKSKNNKEIPFRQFYKDSDQKYRLGDIMTNELQKLDDSLFGYEIFIPDGDEHKYLFENDETSRFEEESTRFAELRGSSFFANDIEIGKLYKVNYPELYLTISEESSEVVITLFDKKLVTTVSPNLIGEIEKNKRLRDTLNSIKYGENLKNPNFSQFIFDSSCARSIEDIEFHLHSDGTTVRELNEHLLNKGLNDSQKQAIIKALLAEDLALIQGPPGTGKSTAIAEIMWQLIRRDCQNRGSHIESSEEKERILLTSETNLAVDNAIDRIVNSFNNLVKPIRIGDEEKLEVEGRQFSLAEMKMWVDENPNSTNEETEEGEAYPQRIILQNWIDNIKRRAFIEGSESIPSDIKAIWLETLKRPSNDIRKLFYKCYLKYCNVIGATCSSIGEKGSLGKWTGFYHRYQEIFGRCPISFTTVIQDESSKSTPAELALPLIYGRRSVVIGDHRQLPPLLDRQEFISTLEYVAQKTNVESDRIKTKELIRYVKGRFRELEISHFERLFTDIDSSLRGTFNLQYRMHPDINEVIRQFYIMDGGLECGLTRPHDLGVNDPDIGNRFSRYHGIEIPRFIRPENHVIWIDVKSPEIQEGTSRINYGEIDAIRWILSEFDSSSSFEKFQTNWDDLDDKQIGLISFYGKQINLLRNLRKEFRKIPLRISSVDRFQGMERNIIIVSMVRSDRIALSKNQKPDFNIYGALGYPEQKDMGFARSPNRLNVALSRAKRLLIIVGNSDLFTQNPIYKQVYDVIQKNPNGRIINYAHKMSEEPLLPILLSSNLNTRDIDDRDMHLRISETWFTENKTNPKIAVLELSTKAVKLLIGDQEMIKKGPFSFDNFIRDTDRTETGNGLDINNLMDIGYFNNHVLPSIQRKLTRVKENKVDVLYTVATAAYRTAENRNDIVSYIKNNSGINVKILSKEEESKATLLAYLYSTSKQQELFSSDFILMIDQGGGSTEVAFFKNNLLILSNSLDIGTSSLRNTLIKTSKRDTLLSHALVQNDSDLRERLQVLFEREEFGIIKDSNCFCIGVGTSITKVSGKHGSSHQHDKCLTKDQLILKINRLHDKLCNRFDTVTDLLNAIQHTDMNGELEKMVAVRIGLPMFIEIMDYYNIQRITVSGAGLWYGIFFKALHNISE